MITFKEAYDRLMKAYMSCEVNAFNSKFCICGNLENNDRQWIRESLNHKRFGKCSGLLNYSGEEYIEMEDAYMGPIIIYFSSNYPNPPDTHGYSRYTSLITQYNSGKIDLPGYEDANFEGFCDAIEVLKEIHRTRGENVDDVVFEKRVRPVKIIV
jgi:hypothetical protein